MRSPSVSALVRGDRLSVVLPATADPFTVEPVGQAASVAL
jgi:hypothetical protein